jgi:hypothetical protein
MIVGVDDAMEIRWADCPYARPLGLVYDHLRRDADGIPSLTYSR